MGLSSKLDGAHRTPVPLWTYHMDDPWKEFREEQGMPVGTCLLLVESSLQSVKKRDECAGGLSLRRFIRVG